jgi:DNA repair exonuclease SbcCD ATPase subunit
MLRKVFTGFGLIVVLIVLYVLGFHRQYVQDYYVTKTVPLDSNNQLLADELNLTDRGKFLYTASQPKVLSSDQFNAACKSVAHEHSIVLGCYTMQKIYIYDVKDERLSGVKQVTAAHELLHAVYERMSPGEKTTLNKQLIAVAESINDDRFKETLDEYRRTEPGQLENEIHSILGTEIAVLPSALEQHYAQYFNKRSDVVAYAKQYEAAFTELDTQIKQYDLDLASLKEEKESLESSLKVQQDSLTSASARLNKLRAQDDPSEYNSAVPEYNDQVRDYNAGVAALKRIIEDYNAIVEKRNAVSATQNDLSKQLDSRYTPLE